MRKPGLQMRTNVSVYVNNTINWNRSTSKRNNADTGLSLSTIVCKKCVILYSTERADFLPTTNSITLYK